jgi:formylglycine-generating enzyme required for sulfatase activity
MLPGEPGRLGVPGDCLKPNDFGLFNMLGNASEWCQDWFVYGTPEEDKEEHKDIRNDDPRVLRGGSFLYPAMTVRSAFRLRHVPTFYSYDVSFRPARTFR